MNNAPIVLFVYNRPLHTSKTLEALKLNELAKESDLYIYSDGPKLPIDEQSVQRVRDYIHSLKGFRNIHVIERLTNLGLANSIISGVSEIIERYNRIIVLEDDIVPSLGFLNYMNESLNLYIDEPKVGCIHAWNYNLNIQEYNESTFFLKGADCWGWATWKRAWDEFNPDGKKLLEIIESKKLEYDFNRRNTHGFVNMLKDQIQSKNDSWAIRWHASLFIKDMYCLHPTIPKVINIGLDNSGVHCGKINISQSTSSSFDIRKIPIHDSDWFFEAYSVYLKENAHSTSTKWQKLKNFLKHLFLQ